MQRARNALLLFALAVPTAAVAAPCAGFTDVDDSSPFCVNVEWMKNRGITFGLTPTSYDPDSPVTRLQMAAFIYRLGFQNAFLQGGSAFGGTATLGTSDNHALDVRVNDLRVMRYEPSPISPNVIGGNPSNRALPGVRGATIAGGGVPLLGNNEPDYGNEAPNQVAGNYGTVGGGYGNRAGQPGQPAGFYPFDTVGGGQTNSAGGGWSTVGGGEENAATGSYGTVSGGYSNFAGNYASTVGGGDNNDATGNGATVAGGTGNVASGTRSAVPGGLGNAAIGEYSFAAGHRAKANANGCFVWADNTAADFICGTPNVFAVRATGGVFIRTGLAPVAGVTLPAGGSAWAPSSDRHGKDNVIPVDPREVLDRLVRVPIATWNYVSQAPEVRHMGPMAQDLHEAFGLGESDRHISTVDADGVALAAIQGLNAKLEAEVRMLHAELAAIRSMLVERPSASLMQTAGTGR